MRAPGLLQDLWYGLTHPPVTEPYPLKRQPVPARLRGRLEYDPTHCIGCGLCAKDCPAFALEVITLDRKAKRFVMRYHEDRCSFCGQCVHSCRQGSLRMNPEAWELAGTDREPMHLILGREADIAELAERSAQPAASPAA